MMVSHTYGLQDGGRRDTYTSGMMREPQTGKARFDLLFPEGVAYEEQYLTRVAMHMARGAEKYAPRQWEQGYDEAALARAKSSAMRHMAQWFHGEDDEDHAAAVFFNIMQVEYLLYKKREQERAE